MNIGAAIVIFVLIWWCVFFAMLPMGVKGDWEQPENLVPGADPGAPENPDLKRKALLTTGVSAVLSMVVIAVIMSGVIDFKD